MNNFDLRKYLVEGKLNENKFDIATTEKIAQAVADAFTAEDSKLDLKYVVNPRIEANSFDLDVEAGPNTPGPEWRDKNGFSIDNYLGEFAGGSFYIKDGVVYNAASRNAPVANVTPEGEVKMISAADSRAAIDMEDDERNPGMYIDDEEWEREMGRMEESKEEKKPNKMKKSELKEMIKSAFLDETEFGDALRKRAGEESFDDAFDRVDKEPDVYPGEKTLDPDYVKEAEEDEEVDVEAEETEDIETADAEVEDTETVDVETTAEISPEVKATQDALTAAIEAAKALGDQKLADQIGNSITFFTRTHVVGQDKVAENVDLFSTRLLKNAGIKK